MLFAYDVTLSVCSESSGYGLFQNPHVQDKCHLFYFRLYYSSLSPFVYFVYFSESSSDFYSLLPHYSRLRPVAQYIFKLLFDHIFSLYLIVFYFDMSNNSIQNPFTTSPLKSHFCLSINLIFIFTLGIYKDF